MSHDHKDEVRNDKDAILSENYESLGGGVYKRREKPAPLSAKVEILKKVSFAQRIKNWLKK